MILGLIGGPTYSVGFIGFHPSFNPVWNNLTMSLLHRFQLDVAEQDSAGHVTTIPDFLFFSVFGHLHRHPRYAKCVKIFTCEENIRPPWNECQYALTGDYDPSPGHLRLPIYVRSIRHVENDPSFGSLYQPNITLGKHPHHDWPAILARKTKFCAFVYSNGLAKERIALFERLSKYKQVDSGGKILNNIGGTVTHKLAFLEDYKFTIAYENASYPGYVSEKIVEPMFVHSLPIYWGSPRIGDDFNTKSFVLSNNRSVDDVVDEIAALDRDDDKMLQKLREPWWNNNVPNRYCSPDHLASFLEKVFEKSVAASQPETVPVETVPVETVPVERIKAKTVVSPPQFLFLSINEICNLRCVHCEYWKSRRSVQQSIDRQREIIEEFATLAPNGKVVICGGEPTLERESYFDVCETSHKHGLRVLSVINGTTVNAFMASQLAIRGPDEISISLDGHDAETHDRLRGRKGAFDLATGALRRLLLARPTSKSPRIYAMGLLGRSTYEHLDEWYDLVLRQIGADKLKLNTLQPSFMHTRIGQVVARDENFLIESQIDPEKLRLSLLACDAKYDLNLNPIWIEQVVSYFDNLREREGLERGWSAGLTTPKHICNTHDRNIMVNVTGHASLCFSNNFRNKMLEHPGDLTEFWRNAEDIREKMRSCNALCGISHSVRREHATMDKSS